MRGHIWGWGYQKLSGVCALRLLCLAVDRGSKFNCHRDSQGGGQKGLQKLVVPQVKESGGTQTLGDTCGSWSLAWSHSCSSYDCCCLCQSVYGLVVLELLLDLCSVQAVSASVSLTWKLASSSSQRVSLTLLPSPVTSSWPCLPSGTAEWSSPAGCAFPHLQNWLPHWRALSSGARRMDCRGFYEWGGDGVFSCEKTIKCDLNCFLAQSLNKSLNLLAFSFLSCKWSW